MPTGTTLFPTLPKGERNGLEAIADVAVKAEPDDRWLLVVAVGVRSITELVDHDHDRTAKFRITAVEVVPDGPDRNRVFGVMEKAFSARTGKQTLDLVYDPEDEDGEDDE